MAEPAKTSKNVSELFPKKQIQTITTTQKNRYALFNTFQLQMSRLLKIPMFQQLVNELKLFNKELEDWKKEKHQIKNFIITYHLYENLSSRLKYLTNFSKSQEASIKGTQEISHWFMLEKPKLRCQVKQPRVAMKHHVPDETENRKIKQMVQYNELKREMLPYEMMSRTAYAGILPPKQQLKQYKRKNFLPFEEEKQKQFQSAKVKKSSSAGILGRNRLSKFRQSVGTVMTTVSTMNDTKSSFKKTVSQFKISEINSPKQAPLLQLEKTEEQQIEKNQKNQKNEPIKQEEQNEVKEEEEDKKIDEDNIEQLEREKQVEQEKLMERNIVRNLGEDDEPDEDDIYDDENQNKETKLYISDNDPEMLEYAEQMSKQARQSTLRRIMKINEGKIRSKLQELDLARNMANWGKIKGKNATGMSRKLQSNLHMNKYREIAYQRQNFVQKSDYKEFEKNEKKFFNATTGFKGYKNKQDKPQCKNVIQAFYRSKSSHPASIESDLRKLKVQEAIQTYGKYIKHLPQNQQQNQTDDPQKATNIRNESSQKKYTQETNFRSTSLTSLAGATNKKKPFSSLLRDHSPSRYNQTAESELLRIKSTLSGKMIPTEKGVIFKAISATTPQQVKPEYGMYTSGRDLLSNPFFPKFATKKKKKKAK